MPNPWRVWVKAYVDSEDWAHAAIELSGEGWGDMSRRNTWECAEPLAGS